MMNDLLNLHHTKKSERDAKSHSDLYQMGISRKSEQRVGKKQSTI